MRKRKRGSRGRQQIKIVYSMSTWCGISATELQRTTNDPVVGTAIIEHASDRHGWRFGEEVHQ